MFIGLHRTGLMFIFVFGLFFGAAQAKHNVFHGDYFNKIAVLGNVDVVIEGASHNGFRLLNNARLSAHVYNGVLILQSSTTRDAMVRPQVRVFIQDLRALYAAGTSSVRGHQITSSGLNIRTKENSSVCLHGKNLPVYYIENQNRSALSISGINSCETHISGHDTAEVFLAGETGRLVARAGDDSFINARYLTAKKGFVASISGARVDVSVYDTLNASAKDRSNIYYFRDPLYFFPYNSRGGSVLRMHDNKPCPHISPRFILRRCDG